jgi:hypothetical protein
MQVKVKRYSKCKGNWTGVHSSLGRLVTLPCAYTRQRCHVARTCASWWRAGVPGMVFAVRVCGRCTAKGGRGRTAKRCARQSRGARQRLFARQRSGAHDKQKLHDRGVRHMAKEGGTIEGHDARQREVCTTMSLPCSFGRAHDKEGVAGLGIVMRSLLCGVARQHL